MDTAPLKAFATKARVDLLKQVRARADVALAPNSVARVESFGAIKALEDAIARDGREAVVDRVAYTWFNRIVALRFMDANGYTPSGVVSPEAGKATGQPEILAEAKSGVFDSAVVPPKMQETITSLLNLTRPSPDPQGEAYGLLLESYCRSWHRAMPFMFEQAGGYTELLMPSALLATDSVLSRAQAVLTEEACHDSGDGNGGVEVVGWLYQFYISERKEEVFAGFKNNKKAGAAEIPAATQLFTPHWIVRYLVENSLGRLWLLNRPSSKLADRMAYYIEPVDGATDFVSVSSPEELKILDPAVGSGHMLTYAFDLLYEIYEEEGYAPADIPGLILEHNLYGVEIDPRAGSLAAFALTMKASARRKTFLKNPIQPRVCVLENVRFEQHDLDYLWSLLKGATLTRGDFDEFWNAFEHADTFGSLVQPNANLLPLLKPVVERLESTGNLLAASTRLVVEQTEQISRRHSVVVANPPYMGGGQMGERLRGWAARNRPAAKHDMYALFMHAADAWTDRGSFVAMVAPHSWMFLSRYEELRRRILKSYGIASMAHLGPRAFEAIGGEVVQVSAFSMVKGTPGAVGRFVRLTDIDTASGKERALLDAASARSIDRVFTPDPREFEAIPGSPVAYWVPQPIASAFSLLPALSDSAPARKGMVTARNSMFLRLWYEVSTDNCAFDDVPTRDLARASGKRWFGYIKGGPARRWWGNLDYVVDWYRDGERLQTERHPTEDRVWATNFNLDYIFRPNVNWGDVSGSAFTARLSSGGQLFDGTGSACFPPESDAMEVLSFLNSRMAGTFLSILNPTLHFLAGDIARIPFKPTGSEVPGSLAARAVLLARQKWDESETSWNFATNALVARDESLIEQAVDRAQQLQSLRANELAEIEQQNDEWWALAYETTNMTDHSHRPDAVGQRNASTLIEDLISYAVGCIFGRYSLDEPGLILASQRSAVGDYRAKVPSPSFEPDADNVIPIVDGDWFEDDIVAKFRQFLRVAFGEEHFEENLKFVVNSLGVKDLRDYFVKSFYKDHVQRYRKRPIYWLFSSPKGSFNALIYLHRYDPSTVSTVLNDYLHSYVNKLEANLQHQERVAAGIGGVSARESATAQKEGDRIRKVLVELRDYEHDVLYPLAQQQVALDLDNGVLVNYQKLGAALKDIGLKKGGGGE